MTSMSPETTSKDDAHESSAPVEATSAGPPTTAAEIEGSSGTALAGALEQVGVVTTQLAK